MRTGTIRQVHRRAMRVLAGVVATFLLTGHVLAAAGMCVINAPAVTAPLAAAQDSAVAEHPCEQHVLDDLQPGSTTVAHHCPAQDPSAQTRSVDVPAPSLISAPAPLWFDRFIDAPAASSLAASRAPAPRPLYERPQRLLL